MKLISHIFLSVFFLSVIASCSKHEGDVLAVDPSFSFRFDAPTAGGSYSPGDTVLVRGTAIAPATIHGYELIIKKAGDTTVLYSKGVHDHNDTLLVNEKWKVDITSAENLEARIIFNLDHDGHTGTSSVVFAIR